MSFKPVVFLGSQGTLEAVDDEVFLELRNADESRFLAKTCYGIAVQECRRISGDSFILRVRPDMRTLLISQLGKHCIVLRVYSTRREPGSRDLFTGRMAIRFTEWSAQEGRRDLFRRYFPSRAGDAEIEDGMYPLGAERERDLRKAIQDLSGEDVVLQAAPVVLGIPAANEGCPTEDLLNLDTTSRVRREPLRELA